MPQPTKDTYRSLFRGFRLFGGVQVFNALVAVVRGKFVAMILGAAGMGINALYNSASLTLQRIASLGLNLAIVKEISAADEADRQQREAGLETGSAVAHSLAAINRLLLATAFGGLIICVLAAPLLSKLTFGNTQSANGFRLLGVALFFMVSAAGKLAILQGLQQTKLIARASVVGGLTGLFVGVPLYWFLGTSGIVPAICIFWFMVWGAYTLLLRKCSRHITPIGFSWRIHSPIVSRLLGLGIVLVTADLLQTLVSYVVNLYVRYHGSVDLVGFYQGANALTMQFSSLVFAAMLMDYLPRLARLIDDNQKMTQLVNRQIELAAVIIGPAVCLLILFAPLIIDLLLTAEFQVAIPLIRWLAIGTMFRALAWPIGAISLGKNNKWVYFLQVGVAENLMVLILSCLLFSRYGLIGLGISYALDNAICLVAYVILNRCLYGYRLSARALGKMLPTAIAGGGCFLASFIGSGTTAIVVMAGITIGIIMWSLIHLRSLLRASQ